MATCLCQSIYFRSLHCLLDVCSNSILSRKSLSNRILLVMVKDFKQKEERWYTKWFKIFNVFTTLKHSDNFNSLTYDQKVRIYSGCINSMKRIEKVIALNTKFLNFLRENIDTIHLPHFCCY